MDSTSQNDCPPACCCQEVALNGSPFQIPCFEGCFFSALLILLFQQSSCVALFSLPGLVALVISIALGPEYYLPYIQGTRCAHEQFVQDMEAEKFSPELLGSFPHCLFDSDAEVMLEGELP